MAARVAYIDGREWSGFFSMVGKSLKDPTRILQAAFATRGVRDIVEHFDDEKGENGSWPKRAQSTQNRYAMIGSGAWKGPRGVARAAFNPSNKLLVMTGAMRKSLLPGRLERSVRKFAANAIQVFSGSPISGYHDDPAAGSSVPQRDFMYLSDRAQDDIGRIVLDLATGDA